MKHLYLFLLLFSLLLTRQVGALDLAEEASEAAIEVVSEVLPENNIPVSLEIDYTYNTENYFSKKINLYTESLTEWIIIAQSKSISSYIYSGDIINKDKVSVKRTYKSSSLVPKEIIFSVDELDFSNWAYGYVYLYALSDIGDGKYKVISNSAYISDNYGKTDSEKKSSFMIQKFPCACTYINISELVESRLSSISQNIDEEKYQSLLESLLTKINLIETWYQNIIDDITAKIIDEEDFERYKDSFHIVYDDKNTLLSIKWILLREQKTNKVNTLLDWIFN